jgi:hypothetical protein
MAAYGAYGYLFVGALVVGVVGLILSVIENLPRISTEEDTNHHGQPRAY